MYAVDCIDHTSTSESICIQLIALTIQVPVNLCMQLTTLTIQVPVNLCVYSWLHWPFKYQWIYVYTVDYIDHSSTSESMCIQLIRLTIQVPTNLCVYSWLHWPFKYQWIYMYTVDCIDHSSTSESVYAIDYIDHSSTSESMCIQLITLTIQVPVNICVYSWLHWPFKYQWIYVYTVD